MLVLQVAVWIHHDYFSKLTKMTRTSKPAGPARTPAGARTTKRAASTSDGGLLAAEVLKHWHEAVPDDRMAHLVKDATRAFLRSLQARLALHGVHPGHWTFLRVLWQQDGLNQHELSLRAGVMAPTTLVALRAMTTLGYVVRRQHADNRKNVYFFLTRAGRALEKRLVPLAEEVNAIALARLTAGEVATTRRALLQMIENLAADEMARA